MRIRVRTVTKVCNADEAAEWAGLQGQLQDASLEEWVRLTTLHITRHAVAISIHELASLRDLRPELELKTVKLPGLIKLKSVGSLPDWSKSKPSKRPSLSLTVPSTPPLVGARTSTAPPWPLVDMSSRVKGFSTI